MNGAMTQGVKGAPGGPAFTHVESRHSHIERLKVIDDQADLLRRLLFGSRGDLPNRDAPKNHGEPLSPESLFDALLLADQEENRLLGKIEATLTFLLDSSPTVK